MGSRPSPEDRSAQQGATPVTAAGAPEMAVESLPLETRFPPFPLRQYKGFWISEITLRAGIPAFHAGFTPRPSDVILASFPKSGTTWLKALAFATLNRAAYPPSDDGDHPFCRSNPHDLVRFIEIDFAHAESVNKQSDRFEALPSPRLLATHLPYSLLPERVRQVCKIVCISREPKDTLVSWWLYIKKAAPALRADAAALTFQEVFDLFCDGRSLPGPYWRHLLEYWEESLRRPEKMLFLRYEELLLEPRGNLKKLAKFMGCEFSVEEEDRGGVVDAIVELCSLGKLKNMEVNRNERLRGKLPVENANFFRKGTVGDWSNHMTPEMAKRLDKIVEDALQGSGLTFNNNSVCTGACSCGCIQPK